MDAHFQPININGAYHFAIFIDNGCGNFICQLLQPNAKWCYRGFGTFFYPLTGQDSGTRNYDAVASQYASLQ